MSLLNELRGKFHQELLHGTLTLDSRGVPSNADGSSRISIAIAKEIWERLGGTPGQDKAKDEGQTLGATFERISEKFIYEAFSRFAHLRPGFWQAGAENKRVSRSIDSFVQFNHLTKLSQLSKSNPDLAAALGNDYTIKPDIVIWQEPLEDGEINVQEALVDEQAARSAAIRKQYQQLPILHASISCKWTIRSDRAQNARTEALNLIRNRKGRLPHIMVLTAEPLPSRIAALALGTGDIDCVYHFALYELEAALEALPYEDARDMLDTLIQGKRLKDISDLPLDLLI
jgi:hypothetical protein